MMRVRFWGVRGSIPCPGPATVRYGGNTPCIELRFSDPDRLIIIDAGSGIRELGNHLLATETGPVRTEIFLTHTHWDHIMGFPFFSPIYIPGTELTIYGPVTHEKDSLEDIVGGQLTYRYFPVRHVELGADITYRHLKEGVFDLGGGVTLHTKYLNHPVLCLGYRFECRGMSVCTVYDTEPFANIFTEDPGDPAYDEQMAEEGALVAAEQNQAVEDFFRGADILIHDAQYTWNEYRQGKTGWGHSPMERVAESAARAGVRRLFMFHYDPMRDDDANDLLAAELCRPGRYGDLEVIFAREGMEAEPGGDVRTSAAAGGGR